ncbi:hypothetical protein, partial [Rosistilla oblonga]|uniref:hypothetical protein n=1 Tax=Rosistilla oblonga TaxID=2527990 RepID=UPI003A978C8B
MLTSIPGVDYLDAVIRDLVVVGGIAKQHPEEVDRGEYEQLTGPATNPAPQRGSQKVAGGVSVANTEPFQASILGSLVEDSSCRFMVTTISAFPFRWWLLGASVTLSVL